MQRKINRIDCAFAEKISARKIFIRHVNATKTEYAAQQTGEVLGRFSPMRLGTATAIQTRPRYFTPCAQCGDALLAPEWSEHVNERCVRHLWTCETCGYQFETTVYLGSK